MPTGAMAGHPAWKDQLIIIMICIRIAGAINFRSGHLTRDLFMRASTAFRAAAAFGLSLAVAAPALAKDVNVYNGRHYGSDQQLWDGFTAKTGIKVNVVSGNSDEIIQRLAQEGDNSPADLLITVDAGRLALAADKNLFQSVETETLKRNVPAHLRAPDGSWYGLSVRARVAIIDPAKVKPEQVNTYAKLADPGLKGQLLIRSGTNIYNLGLLGAVIEAQGAEQAESWAKGIVANMARPSQGGDTDQIKAVGAGIGGVAVSNTYYLGRLIGSGSDEEKAMASKLKVVFPDLAGRGTHVNISGAGVTRVAKNKDNAVKLLEYLSSPEAQRYFADINYEYPVHPEVKPHAVLEAFGPFKQDGLNAAAYAKRSAEASRIMDRAGWK